MKKSYFTISLAKAQELAKAEKCNVAEYYNRFRSALDRESIPSIFTVTDFGCDVQTFGKASDAEFIAKGWGFAETDLYGITASIDNHILENAMSLDDII